MTKQGEVPSSRLTLHPSSLLLHLQHREKRLLRDLYGPDLLHPLLPLLLLLQELPLAGDIAAIALRQHVAIGAEDVVLHGGDRGDQVEIELPLQPFLHDFHVQQAEEAAAEAEAER